MKRTLLFIAVLSLALSTPAFSGLGNSDDQIADLFGQPIHIGNPDKRGVITNVYEKGNYVILVQFLKGLSLAESYTRLDKQELSEKEISAFLEGSSNDRPWNKDPDRAAWERSDHKAHAWYQKLSGRPTLFIDTTIPDNAAPDESR
jgi:hypothetical protein